jgi:hypothetical protein
MITMNEQLASLTAELNEIRDQIGRPPPPPPKRIPAARCISQSFSVARLSNNRCGAIRDDEQHTKVSVMEAAKKIAQKTGLPIRYIPWQVELADVTGADAILIIERLHVATDDGDNGHRPTTIWNFSSLPPKWLKFNGAEPSEVII